MIKSRLPKIPLHKIFRASRRRARLSRVEVRGNICPSYTQHSHSYNRQKPLVDWKGLNASDRRSLIPSLEGWGDRG